MRKNILTKELFDKLIKKIQEEGSAPPVIHFKSIAAARRFKARMKAFDKKAGKK